MCYKSEQCKVYDELSRSIISDDTHPSLWNDKCDYIKPESCTDLNPNNLNLVVLQLNVHGILSNVSELKQLLHTLEMKKSRVDLVLLCKMFLTPQMTKLDNIPEYTVVSNHCKNSKGGGTAILIRNGINYKCRTDLDVFEEKVTICIHRSVCKKL